MPVPWLRGITDVSNKAPNGGWKIEIALTGLFCNNGEMTFITKPLVNVGSGCALSSVVEHYLHTVGVAGSKPAARTILWFQFL